MMRNRVPRLNIVTGFVSGLVEWASSSEIIILVSNGTEDSFSCRLTGKTIQGYLATRRIVSGMHVTAQGEIVCRQADTIGVDKLDEIIMTVTSMEAEEAKGREKFFSTLYVSMKGIIMHLDERYALVRTYINKGDRGRDDDFVCSITIAKWLSNLEQGEASHRLKAKLTVGREYMLTGLGMPSSYSTSGANTKSCLRIFPLDFKLLG